MIRQHYSNYYQLINRTKITSGRYQGFHVDFQVVSLNSHLENISICQKTDFLFYKPDPWSNYIFPHFHSSLDRLSCKIHSCEDKNVSAALMESSKSTVGCVSMTTIEILIGSHFRLNLSAHTPSIRVQEC